MAKEDAPDLDSDDPVEAAWQALSGSWDKDEAHRKFLALCETLDRTADAGRRYRSVVEAGGDRAADAKKRIDQLMARAMTRMAGLREEPNTRPRSFVLFVGFLMAAALLAFAASYFL